MCTGMLTTNIFRRRTVISRRLLQIKRCNPLRGCILVGPAGFEPTQWRSQSPLPYRLATAQQKKRPRSIITVRSLVGCLERFELSASRATIWRANQLRHRHHIMRPKGLEPPAHCLEGSCSIQLSYWRKSGAGDGNRTRIPSLEGWCPGHCATPARALRNLSAFA